VEKDWFDILFWLETTCGKWFQQEFLCSFSATTCQTSIRYAPANKFLKGGEYEHHVKMNWFSLLNLFQKNDISCRLIIIQIFVF
jgi:hypothetical protein